MESILCFLKEYSNAIQALSAVCSAAAVVLAVYIPRRIMINQLYAGLYQEYRSPEMGEAIFSIFRFYVEDCENCIANIAGKYEEKYKEEIEIPLKNKQTVDYAKTLHFQRRLLAHFFWNIAELRYERRFPGLSTRELRRWHTPQDTKLIAILLHMVEPAKAVFAKAGEVPEPPEDDTPMNRLIGRLYEEAKEWV
ncbi:MAG: hypothetical protein LBP80_04330 [Treponema sp.]|jgi:hypothetical protein|nr:hypothetical protein [Treponema sp.]